VIVRAFRSGHHPPRQVDHGSCARDDDAHAGEQEQVSGRDFDHDDRFERACGARACREIGAVPRGVLGRERGGVGSRRQRELIGRGECRGIGRRPSLRPRDQDPTDVGDTQNEHEDDQDAGSEEHGDRATLAAHPNS